MKTLFSNFRSNFKKIVLIGTLAVVIIFQTYIIISNYGKLWVSRTVRTYSLPAMERNALFVFGGNGLEFLDFLSTTIPLNAAVVMPPNAVQFSRQNLLQFFLYPRTVLTCYCDEKSTEYSTACIKCLRMDNYYIPAIGDFPSDDVMQGSKKFISFDKDTGWYHGIYVPLDHTSSDPLPLQYKVHQLPTTIILDFLICFLIFLLGYHLSSAMLHIEERKLALATAFPLGIGVMTWLVFVVAWIGFPLTLTTFISIYIVILITIIAIKRRMRKEKDIFHPVLTLKSMLQELSGKKPVFIVVLLIVIFMFTMSVIISVGRGYSLFDGIANWALKGYAIANEGSIYAGKDWGGHSLSYPMNIHLMIALFNLADGDVLPGSKMVFPLFFASVVIGSYHFWRVHGINQKVAGFFQAIFWTVPIFFLHATIGFANLPTACYLVLGYLWGVEGVFRGDRKAQMISGILLGLASWTRLEAVAYSIIAYISILISWWLIKRGKPSLLFWGFPFTIITAVWWLFYLEFGQAGSSVVSTLEHSSVGISSGFFNLPAIGVIINNSWIQILSINTWGIVFPLLAIGLIVGWKEFRPRINPGAFASFMGMIAFAGATALIFYAFSFNSYPDQPERFISWLTRGFARQNIPAIMMAVVTLPFLFKNSFSNQDDDDSDQESEIHY